MRKKLFTIALSAIMVIAMAVPAFAAARDNDFGEIRGKDFVSYAYEGGSLSNKNLNVYGNDSIAPGRNVCIWSGPVTAAQRWNYLNRDGNYRLFSSLVGGESFALNVYRVADAQNTYNCNVNQTAGNLTDTSVRWYTPSNGVTGSVTVITWKAASSAKEYYLTAMSNKDDGDVRWVPKDVNISGASRGWW